MLLKVASYKDKEAASENTIFWLDTQMYWCAKLINLAKVEIDAQTTSLRCHFRVNSIFICVLCYNSVSVVYIYIV